MGRHGKSVAGILLATGLCTATWSSSRSAEEVPEKPRAPAVIRIGLVNSLLRDVPDSVFETMSKPLAALMAKQTGMAGRMVMVKAGEAVDLGQQLVEQKVHLGIFHGFEFAWARQKYPQLKPAVIAVNQQQHLRALLIVRSDSQVKDFGGMKERSLSFPKGTRAHCRLFLERRCQDCARCAVDAFVARIESSPNTEEALDDVVDGAVDAAITDGVSLDCYKRRKPGRYESLKVALESEIFPAAVVAYHPGTLDEKAAGQFRDGLVHTHKTILGRQLLTFWKMTSFEAVPADYEQLLADIVKAYPPAEENQD